MTLSRRQAAVDIGIVLSFAVGYVIAEAIDVPKRWILVGLALLLAAFAWFVWKRRGESARDLGLGWTEFLRGAGPVLAGTIAAVAGIVAWALATGRTVWRSDLAVLLPLYPVYGVAQQLIFQGVLHRRLMVLIADRRVTVALTALVFAAAHVGDWRLVGLTAVAGAAWSAAFVRWPSVLALGLSHGILAALTYPLILGDQPLARI